MPTVPHFGGIPVTRLRVDLVAHHAWTPPPHVGDMMRRALVSGIYAVVPERHQEHLLGGWFDDRSGPHRARPYALQVHAPVVPERGDVTQLDLTLAGRVPEPRVLLDGLRHLASKGLSDARVPHTVARIQAWGAVDADVDPQTGSGFPPAARLEDLLELPTRQVDGVLVRLRTPFTPPIWRPPERPESLAVGPRLLFDVAARRVRMLQRALGIESERWWREPQAWTEACDLVWVEHEVQSRRKRNPDVLGGVVGAVALRGRWGDLVPLLAAAEVLQVGRATSRGHGVIEIEWMHRE